MFTVPRRPRGGSDARVSRPSAEDGLSALIRRSDLGLFFGGTFGLSWLMWALVLLAGGRIDEMAPYVLFVVGAFGPTLVAAALWLAGRRRPRGRQPFRDVHRWLPAALLLGAAPALTAALLTGSFDLQAAGRQVSALGGPLAVVAFTLLTGPLSEEFGWRGYAQPRLRHTLSPWATSVVLGLAWGLWHLPLFLLTGTSQSELGLFSWEALLFFVGWVPVSYTIWTVSERLRGGVAAAVVAHAALNAADGLFPAASTAGALIGTAAATGIAIALSVLNGRAATAAAWSRQPLARHRCLDTAVVQAHTAPTLHGRFARVVTTVSWHPDQIVRNVVFVVPVGVHLLDLAGPAQVFSGAVDVGAAYRPRYVGERERVHSHQGVEIGVDTTWPDLTADDIVLVCGHHVGDRTPRSGLPPSLLRRLVEHHDRGGRVVSVCSGAFALAEAGLLDGRRATTHHEVAQALARRHPAIQVVPDVLYVADGRLATSAGIASGIDLALHLVAVDHGPALAARVARSMVLSLRRNGDAPQDSAMLRHRDHLVDTVHRAQDIIDARFTDTLPLRRLAGAVGVSERTLTRRFRGATGVTPLRYQQALRVERADDLVAQGWTGEAAAHAVGFRDARMLRRLRTDHVRLTRNRVTALADPSRGSPGRPAP